MKILRVPFRGRATAFALALGLLCSVSMVTFAGIIRIPVDGIPVLLKRLTISGQVSNTGLPAGPTTLTLSGPNESRSATVSAGGSFAFHFRHFTQQLTYRVSAFPSAASPQSVCTVSPPFRDVVLGPSDDKPSQDFVVNCLSNLPPTISPVGSSTVSAIVNGVTQIQVQVTDPQGTPVSVQFFDDRTNNFIANGTCSGGICTLFYSPTGEGVYRIRAVASVGTLTSSTYITVAALARPSANVVLNPAKPTSTVGAVAGSLSVGDSGAATYSIPIPVPPGPAGMQPTVSLNYSSQAGHGIAGYGWSIGGASTITRCGATIATDGFKAGINYDNDAANDFYCLDGQRLVPVGVGRQQYGSVTCGTVVRGQFNTEFRTEIDSYARIVAYEDDPCTLNGPLRFEVQTKSGQWLMYGGAANRGEANGAFGDGDNGVWVVSWPSIVAQTGRSNSAKAWPLVRMMDRAGNLIRFQYCGAGLSPTGLSCALLPTAGGANVVIGSFPPTEFHLKTILYGGHASTATRIKDKDPIAKVSFTYGSRPSSDQIRAFDSGAGETTLTYALQSIATSVDNVFAQSLFMDYESGGITQRYRLQKITQCAGGPDANGFRGPVCLAPTTFGYSPDASKSFSLDPHQITGSQSDVNAAGDIDGDGRTDLIYVPDNSTVVWVALSSANFTWSSVNVGETVSRGSERYLADYTGDGKADLILKRGDGTYRMCDLRQPGGPAVCVNPNVAPASNSFYLQGDFNGDGRIDFLLFRGQQGSDFRWDLHYGDANTGMTAAPVPVIANLPNPVDVNLLSKQFAVGDFDGDGRMDVIYRQDPVLCNFPQKVGDATGCKPTERGTKWTICFSRPPERNGGRPFDCPLITIDVDGGNGVLEKAVILDFNGDGLSDLAYPSFPNGGAPAGSEDLWNICLSAGDGSFRRPDSPQEIKDGEYTSSSLCKTVHALATSPNNVVFGDFDGDGRTDMATHKSGTTWTVCLSRNEAIDTFANNVVFSCSDWTNALNPNGPVSGNVLSGDFNGDGKTDLFGNHSAPFEIRVASGGISDQLLSVQNGLGALTTVAYAPLTDTAIHTPGASVLAPGEINIQSPLYVVKSTTESNGIGGTFNHDYRYAGLKGSTTGRGLLGFASRTVTDSSGLKRVTQYNQDLANWWRAGRVSRTQTMSTANVILSDAKNDWQQVSGTAPGIFGVHLVRTLQSQTDLDGTPLPCTRMALTDPATNTPGIDGFGNVLVTYTDSASSCNLNAVPETYSFDGFRKTTRSAYEAADTTNWVIGRLKRSTVTHEKTGAPAVTRTSGFSYQGMSGASCAGAPYGNLCSEVVEPDEAASSDLRHDTTYEYDDRGNVTKTTQQFAGQAAIRIATTAFDPTGRFPQTLTNPATHAETRTYDSRFGAVLTSTRQFGSTGFTTTTSKIDDFGRKVGETMSGFDGAKIAETDVTWAAQVFIDPPTAYSVTTTAHTGAQTTVFYDSLQRETSRTTRAFNSGTFVLSTTKYDALGRVFSTATPISTGTLKRSFTYDELGRETIVDVTGTTTQDSSITKRTIVYKGLFTAVKQANGTAAPSKVITEKNSQGQVVRVTECLGGNTVDESEVTCQGGGRGIDTTYGYDAAGNVTLVTTPPTSTNPAGLQRSASFDRRGRKQWSVDPDLGRSDFTYTGAGELATHRYTRSQGEGELLVSYIYDRLGRRRFQTGPGDFSATWSLDDCGFGRINGTACATRSVDAGVVTERFTYFDVYARPYRSTLGVGANPALDTNSTFTLPDSQGRPSQIVHPTMQGMKYAYTSWTGELATISSLADSTVLWQANARNSDGRISSMTIGTIPVTQSYNGFGLVKTIAAQNGTLQNATYTWDAQGLNLLTRSDAANPFAGGTFDYDTLNRLRSVDGAVIGYDDAGNIMSRDGLAYTYNPGTNRVSSVPTKSYAYDQVGNILTGAGRTVAWKTFNMPASITSGGASLQWSYDADRSRSREISSATGTTTYFPGMDRIQASDGTIRYRHYIATPEGTVGAFDLLPNNTIERRYWLRDHLGSVVAVVDGATGAKTSMPAYKVWGERSSPVTLTSASTQQGFTGHEMLDEVGLVNMNGRIYDPALGKFLSADPVVQAPFSGQSYNRYSYVMNNPLSATDPSGYASTWVQWRRPVGAIAAAVILGPGGLLGDAGVIGALGLASGETAAALSAVTAGFAAGGIGGGNVESAVMGAFMAAANYGIGSGFMASDKGLQAQLWNVGAHTVVGCMQQAGAGGSCRGGALAGGFSAAAGFVWTTRDFGTGLARSLVVGAVASRLGGGSAQNGALTAAFEYLFNYLSHAARARIIGAGAILGGTAGAVVDGACAVGTGGICAAGAPALIAGGAAMGLVAGDAVANTVDTIGNAIHGNSLLSPSPTTVYQLEYIASGDIYKYGITSDTDGRYSQTYLNALNVRMVEIMTFRERAPARMLEYMLCGGYVVSNGKLPAGSSRC